MAWALFQLHESVRQTLSLIGVGRMFERRREHGPGGVWLARRRMQLAEVFEYA